MNNGIAVVILNYIQYVNVKPGIDELIKRGYNVDIYVPESKTDDGFQDMFNNTLKLLKKNGYTVHRKLTKKVYKVLLEPYPCMDIKSTYKIKYRYSMISAKPNVVYDPYSFLMYDTIMCSGVYDSNYLRTFTNTEIVGNLKYANFKRKKHSFSKKVLLYLPTYGDVSSIELIMDQLSKLRKDYHVVVKIHHGTTFLRDEKERIDLLKNNVDEFYDCFKDLNELLSFADVVLTDNSGSIFEALFVHVPVAVFCKDINANALENFNTTQFELYKEGILPYTSNKNKINDILKDACSDKIFQNQKRWSLENFHYTNKPAEEFADLVIKFLNDNINERYYQFHKIFSNKYYNLLQERYTLNSMIDNYSKNENKLNSEFLELQSKNSELDKRVTYLSNKNQSLLDELNVYKNSKLYKICKKIYKIINKVRRR